MDFVAEFIFELLLNYVFSTVIAAIGVILYLLFLVPFLLIARFIAHQRKLDHHHKPTLVEDVRGYLSQDQVKVVQILHWVTVFPLAWYGKEFCLMLRNYLPQFGPAVSAGLPAYRVYLDPGVSVFVALSLCALWVPRHRRIAVTVVGILMVGFGGLMTEVFPYRPPTMPPHVYNWILVFCAIGYLKALGIAHWLDVRQNRRNAERKSRQ